jgi:transcriptional regulator with XRE-family HTH domain
MTQEQVAARLGRPQSYVAKYETGDRRLDAVELLEVCEVLTLKPGWILDQLRPLLQDAPVKYPRSSEGG